MNRETLILIIATAVLIGACVATHRAVRDSHPRLALTLKHVTAATVILGLAGSVATATEFYTARPAVLAYMAAPALACIIWTLYRLEAANPGRISGPIRGLAGGGRARTRRTGSSRQGHIVAKFLPSLRGWLTLAIFEDKLPWRLAHISSIAAGWLTAAFLPSPPAWIAPWLLVMISTTRWMRVQGIRNQTIKRVYAIAASHLDYSKAVNSRLTSGGAQFASATGAINVEWQDLTTPIRILVAFPVTFAKTDMAKRTTFENEFDASLEGNGWKFDWDTAATTVTITVASYPTGVRWESRTPEGWSNFYIGDELDDGMNATFDVMSESPHILVAGETGSGKMLELSTNIPTPGGWKKFGDVHPGDTVLGPDGKPVTVVFETKADYHDAYEVTFSDGATIIASDDHLWFTETRDIRKARSKQKGDYLDTSRRQLLHTDVVARLRADAEKAGSDDAVTALDAAMLAGVGETSTWFRQVLSGLPVVGHVQEVRDFQYAAQEVTQEQTVLRYDAPVALTALTRSRSIRGEARERLDALIADNSRALVTATELADELGLPVTGLRRKIWGYNVPATPTREKVRLTVPAKTVTRAHRKAKAYRKADLFLALADAGERYAHDQRQSMAQGAVRTTRQIMETLRTADGALNHSIPVTQPLQLPEVDLPIAPYTLGAWLGDGSSWGNSIVGIDHQIARNIEADGYSLTECEPDEAERQSQKRHEDYRTWSINGLYKELTALGLRKKAVSDGQTKHIPADYLRASEAQRRALLAGLLDTDGTVAPQGTVQFTNTNRALAYGVHELALTLGYRATLTEGIARLNGVDYGPKWTVSFTTTDHVFRLDRKNRVLDERTVNYNKEKNAHRYIVDVRPTGQRSLMKCIQVDSADHLYLAGDHLIPTHNTEAMFVIAAQALLKGWDIAICDPKETGWAMWTRRRRPTNVNGHDTGAEKLRPGDARPGVIEHAIEAYGIRDVLNRCKAEMQRRKKINGANKVVKWTELPDEVKEAENIRPLMIVVDEALSLFDMKKGSTDDIKEENEVRGEALSSLQTLIVEARALGIHVLMGIQRPDAAVLGGAMRSNLGARIACGVMEPTGYQMMFQVQSGVPRLVVNNAEGKKVIGRALVRSSPGQPIVPIQVAWLGPGQADLEDVAPMPPEPEAEDETPHGAFNPYVTFDDPTPWLSQNFPGTSTPPWETGESGAGDTPAGAAFDAIDQMFAGGGAGGTASGMPWDQMPPEAPPWEQSAPETPAWADQIAPEAPAWEQVSSPAVPRGSSTPAVPGTPGASTDGDLAVEGAWLTPTPSWGAEPGSGPAPALAQDIEDEPDDVGSGWFAGFLGEAPPPAISAPTPAAPQGSPPVAPDALPVVPEEGDGWWG